MTYKDVRKYIFLFFIIILVIIVNTSFTYAEKDSNFVENLQSIKLISPNFAVVIPKATGGPIYSNDSSDVLKANTGIIMNGTSYKQIDDTNGISIYIVREGDTLSEIAELFDVSINTIKWENNIKGNSLKIGDELKILPVSGVSHTIKKGDTFSKIAKKYDVEVEDITVFNDIDSTKLSIGKKIIVPNGVKNSTSVDSIGKKVNKKISSIRKKISGIAQSNYYIRPTNGIITSKFGPRKSGYHYGIDFGAYRGAPIIASASGTVIKAVYGCQVGYYSCGGGYGNHIIIQHKNGTQTKYAHLNKIIVRKGDTVVKGQKIGEMGNTGNVRPKPRSTKSTAGTHLHFEIIKSNGQKINPNNIF